MTANALPAAFVTTSFAKNNAKGAETSIYLASSPSVKGKMGKYLRAAHVSLTAPQVTAGVIARKS